MFILHWLLLSMSFSPIFVLITPGLWCVTALWGLVSGQWHSSRHGPHSFTLIPLTTKLPQHSDIKLNGNKTGLRAARTESWPPCWAPVLWEETAGTGQRCHTAAERQNLSVCQERRLVAKDYCWGNYFFFGPSNHYDINSNCTVCR